MQDFPIVVFDSLGLGQVVTSEAGPSFVLVEWGVEKPLVGSGDSAGRHFPERNCGSLGRGNSRNSRSSALRDEQLIFKIIIRI